MMKGYSNVNNLSMNRTILLLTIMVMMCVLALCTGIYTLLTVTGTPDKDCISSLEARFNYLERKLCDPMSSEACYIDPTLQTELGDWYERELIKCN